MSRHRRVRLVTARSAEEASDRHARAFIHSFIHSLICSQDDGRHDTTRNKQNTRASFPLTIYSPSSCSLMGLFSRRRRPSVTRIAEGGGPEVPLPATPLSSSAAAAAAATKKPDASLDLFGADSDDSDDDATIDRYANGATPDDSDDAFDDERAVEAESRKVTTLLSKVREREDQTRSHW